MKLVTFGYRYPRTAPIGADVVFDARCLKEDPAEHQTMSGLTGKDPSVQRYLYDLPDVQRFISAVEAATLDLPPDSVVAVACHSGRHRSVAIVEAVANRLHATHVEHLDMLRTPTEDLAPDFV